MKAINLFTLFTGLMFIIAGCNKPDKFSYKIAADDSLKKILNEHHKLVRSVNEANLILDSLDYLSNSTSQFHKRVNEPIVSRVQRISKYVKATEIRIVKAESALKRSRKEASAYFLMMDALKDEVRIRDEELQLLSDSSTRKNTMFSAASLIK